MIKSKEEIEKLKKASLLADECFEYICGEIKIGMSEKEISTLMDKYMLLFIVLLIFVVILLRLWRI